MGLQLFGTRKCPETRKADRFLKERKLSFQFVDLADKGISPGELASIARAVGGAEALLDREGARFRNAGLGYMDFDTEEKILEDPLLIRTPVLRDGSRALVGFDAAAWKAFVGGR
jgi:arsenate reductase (glutaredoxin)